MPPRQPCSPSRCRRCPFQLDFRHRPRSVTAPGTQRLSHGGQSHQPRRRHRQQDLPHRHSSVGPKHQPAQQPATGTRPRYPPQLPPPECGGRCHPAEGDSDYSLSTCTTSTSCKMWCSRWPRWPSEVRSTAKVSRGRRSTGVAPERAPARGADLHRVRAPPSRRANRSGGS
jgi:hypothetical protein